MGCNTIARLIGRLGLVAICVFPASRISAVQVESPRSVDFQRDVLPLLSDRCFSCHGPDASANESGLQLDDRSAALAELPSGEGFAIVPGRPQKSELVRRIREDDPELKMPPPDAHRAPLAESEIQKLENWIEAGAPYNKHWSFEPLPAEIAVPNVRQPRGIQNEIDQFVRFELENATLENASIMPAPEAERWRWLRRVTLDLNGLPATIEERAAFEQDGSAEAYERVVDRLLASPRFGQHMAVAWLDVARYADSYGYQSDLLCNVWPYRDFVVDAFNRNLPYDQFITWQIAGDLLPAATREQRTATAFNRLHRQTNEGGSLDEEWRAEYAADRVQTLGMAFLGLTLECARCHDHKFDPISTREYYQLVAFFNNIDEYGTYNDMHHIPTPTLMLTNQAQDEQLNELATRRANLTEAIRAKIDPRQVQAPSLNTKANAESSPFFSRYVLDERNEKGEFPSSGSSGAVANCSPNNKTVDGKYDKALQFSGDDGLSVPAFQLLVNRPYAISFWLRINKGFENGMVWHQTSGTDTGFSGTEMKFVNGRLQLAMIRFWPGNAIAIESRAEVPRDEWVHIVAGYDGTADAGGLSIWINGQRDNVVIRNNLYKSPAVGDRITFGERFRTLGLTGGAIDDLVLFERDLAADEVAAIAAAQDSVGVVAAVDSGDVKFGELAALRSDERELVGQIFAIRDGIPELMVMKEMDQPRATYVLERGRYDAAKTDDRRVGRGVPRSLPRFPPAAPQNRLGLAQWLTHPDHPLTSRVAVNRIWSNFFGRGLVETAEDFGLQGSRPTHPQLLDWLARDFVTNGWDVKRLCKEIALSSTYRQTSQVSAAVRARDPGNRMLARGPSLRLSAEQIRDCALAASGLLDDRLGGPPVSPYQPDGLWTESNSMSPAYHESVGQDLHRRSLYSVWKRTAPLPNMLALDSANREVCSARRSLTNTPVQAFVLLNDPQFVEAAVHLARSTFPVDGRSDDLRVGEIFERVCSRQPTSHELDVLRKLLHEQRAIFADAPDDAERFLAAGRSSATDLPGATPVELAAMAVVSQAIFNSDAAVSKR